MIHGHGGNIFEAARAIGCAPEEIIDMSSNINPLGPPPGLVDRLLSRIRVIERLPEVDGRGITDAMAHFLGCPPSSLLAGNGTTRFIHCLPEALDTRSALILGPTYADYESACRKRGLNPIFFHTTEENGFSADLDGIEELLPGVDTVFICNPNNPTGSLIPGDRIIQLAHRHEWVRFIVDESYLPFVENGEKESLIHRRSGNLIVLHSLSKIFRIPGLRIGFIAAGDHIIENIRKHLLPWSVNALAQEAVRYLTENEVETRRFIDASRKKLSLERKLFQEFLNKKTALAPMESVASFFLARIEDGRSPEELCAELMREKILIRNCGNFNGLSGPWVRISLKTEKENHKAAGILARLMPRQ